MARSKNLHLVRYRIPLVQPNDPADTSFKGEIDIATLLSKQLGRTIKQNQSFRLSGWGAFMTRNTGEDLDGGMASTVALNFCPTTKWTVKGHKMLQDAYWKQSAFREGMGAKSLYDEFEVSMYESYSDDRTSKVYVGGVSDPAPETCVLYGSYDADGSDRKISAEALINAHHPPKTGGVLIEDDFIFDDEVHYKEAKFDSHFAPITSIGASATMSASFFYDHDIGIDEIYDTQGIATSSFHDLGDNHLNILAGRIHYDCTVLPRDDENIIADGTWLVITLALEGWSPLHYRRKSKGGKKYSRKPRRSSRRRYKR